MGNEPTSCIWYSDTNLNRDSMDHMLVYKGKGDKVQLNGLPQTSWTSHQYILAFEGDEGTISDKDYIDMIVMVEF